MYVITDMRPSLCGTQKVKALFPLHSLVYSLSGAYLRGGGGGGGAEGAHAPHKFSVPPTKNCAYIILMF